MSPERTNLEPSNLVCALIVRPTNQKYKSRLKGEWPASRDLLLILEPLYVSGRGKATELKFELKTCKPKDAKLGQ